MMPEIVAAYDQRRESRMTFWIIIALLFSILSGVCVLLWLRDRKARFSAMLINSKLQHTNLLLNDLNQKLKVSDKVKEAYLTEFMTLSSSFVEALSDYRSHLASILRKSGITALKSELTSEEYEKHRTGVLYDNFDRVFLSLFPDFIEGVNNLLQPENRLALKSGGSMTTELRVLALIRLGITDSDRIAAFLRRSKSTVYNTRVKLRNGSNVPR